MEEVVTTKRMTREFDGPFFVVYFVMDLVSDSGKFLGCIATCMEDGSIHRLGVHSTIDELMRNP